MHEHHFAVDLLGTKCLDKKLHPAFLSSVAMGYLDFVCVNYIPILVLITFRSYGIQKGYYSFFYKHSALRDYCNRFRKPFQQCNFQHQLQTQRPYPTNFEQSWFGSPPQCEENTLIIQIFILSIQVQTKKPY